MVLAQVYAERATSHMLIGPDWSINMELCDAVNSKPHELKEALKTLKKRLGNKSPNIQILALFALETLAKNCGTIVFKEMAQREILLEMMKIVKKTQSLQVKEKILSLINVWQAVSGGERGNFPQYYAAYNTLIFEGFNFPPEEENPALYKDEKASQDLNQSDSSVISVEDMKHAEGAVSVLSDMLNALNPNDTEVKQELIVDLVETCRAYQKRVSESANATTDERLLGTKLLPLNDSLQRVIQLYEGIAEGKTETTPITNSGTKTATAPFFDFGSDSEDDFPPLELKSENTSRSTVLPRIAPPPSRKREVAELDNSVEFGQPLSEEDFVMPLTKREVEKSDNCVDLGPPLSEEDFVMPPTKREVEKSNNCFDLGPPLSEEAFVLPPASPPVASGKMKEVEVMVEEKKASSSGKKATDHLFDELMEEFWNIKNRSIKQ